MEVRNFRSIQVNIQKNSSTCTKAEELSNMYTDICIYLNSLKRRVQIVQHKRIIDKLITRKRKRELEEPSLEETQDIAHT